MGGQPDSSPEPASTSGAIRATVDGNHFLVLDSGRARLDSILDLINGAKHSVRLIFYIFASDEAGHAVRDALAGAARRGVKVTVLLDGYGCSGAKADFFQPIKDEGGSFCLFLPAYGRRYLIRNHQKLAIADEKRAIIGGANVHDAYLHDNRETDWRDLWVRIEGPIVQPAARYFDSLYRWTRTKGATLRKLRRIVARHSDSRGILQWKFSGPLSRRNSWPSALGRELASARRTDIIAAYFAPPRSLLRRLGRMARRGQVRVITASKSDNNATIGAARHTYSRLLRRGVRMYEYQPARLHSKLAIVDDVVHVGSANLDFRSLYINLEIMLRIDDPGFAASMRRYFEAELADSEQITPELHRRRATLWRRFKWTISHWLVTALDYTVTRRLNFNER